MICRWIGRWMVGGLEGKWYVDWKVMAGGFKGNGR